LNLASISEPILNSV